MGDFLELILDIYMIWFKKIDRKIIFICVSIEINSLYELKIILFF